MKTKLLLSLPILLLFPMLSRGQISNDSINKMPKYGKDSIQCITKMSLYRETFKQWKMNDYKAGAFDGSYNYWRWVYDNCPKASLNIYVDGVYIMNDKYERATTDVDKKAYFDTIMMIYDQRIQYFGKRGYVLERKALDYAKYHPAETQNIYNILDEAITLENNSSMPSILDIFFKESIQLYKEGKADKSIIIDNYDKVMNIIEYNIANNNKDKNNFLGLKADVEKYFEPYASCDDIIPIYTKKFNANPNDTALLEKIEYMLDKKGCTGSKLFEDVAIQYQKIKPSPESAFMIGKLMLKKEDYNQAINYLKDAVNIKDNDKAYDAYLLLAHCYEVQKNFPESRRMAQSATKYKPNSGEPYILIGDLYAMSSGMCKSDDRVANNSMFWAAVDMYMKAKSVDSSVSEDANKRINEYSKYFPTKENIFFTGLVEGNEYEVGCWINVKTTIRAAR